MTTMEQPAVLALPSMARRLRVSQRWLRTEADAGRIPHIRAGARYLFTPDAVEAVLADRAAREGVTVEGAAQ